MLLAQNKTGYVNLMRLTSIAHQQGFYYKPRIDFEALSEFNEGLVALTACPGGVVAGAFHHGGEQAAREQLERYLRLFGPERLFLEIQYHGLEIEETFRQWAREVAPQVGVRLVATNDCHYVHADDARAHDIALCLRDKKLLTDTDRLSLLRRGLLHPLGGGDARAVRGLPGGAGQYARRGGPVQPGTELEGSALPALHRARQGSVV